MNSFLKKQKQQLIRRQQLIRLGGCVSLSMAEGAPSVSEFRIQIRYGGRFSIQNTADQRDGEER